MIPTFPDFKKIEIGDKKGIESFTHRYHPYSDFNFTNLWAWDTHSRRRISKLNGNLVVLFTDYITGEPSLSFLGTHKCDDTAHQLLQFARTSKLSPVLRYITEESIKEMRSTDLHIVDDKHNFDYIFSVSQLAHPQGSKLKEKRYLAKRFVREYPEASFELRGINEKSAQGHIISVLRRWEKQKKLNRKEYDIEHEEKAIRRILSTPHDHKLVLSCVILDDVMLGFSIDEILPNKYAISHFIKADVSFKGIYEFLNERVAQYLLTHHVELWNWEQDLNIEGLQRLKTGYRPVHFLKKYRVSLKTPHFS